MGNKTETYFNKCTVLHRRIYVKAAALFSRVCGTSEMDKEMTKKRERGHRLSEGAHAGNRDVALEQKKEQSTILEKGDTLNYGGETVESSSAAALQKELSSLPFNELQKIREKIGIKDFNLVMHGHSSLFKSSRQSENDISKKRKNKNRPMETSSKRTVSRRKKVVSVTKTTARDPRFDDLSGEFNETYYQQAYGFLSEMKDKEKQKLKKRFEKEQDLDAKNKIGSVLKRISHHEKVERDKKKRKELQKIQKEKERDQVQHGKKPFYLKKSEKKNLELAEKFRELRKSGKVEHYLSKKRKKNAGKDRKKLPAKL